MKREPSFARFGIPATYRKMFFGRTAGQSGEDLFAAPALALEVDDVGLHEHRAAVAEDRHSLRGKRDVGILLDLVAQSFGRALQEVSIARRALRVELEVFDATVFQDDELDVLPAHVDDDVRILVELHRRLGVRHGLDQRYVGLEHIVQDVFGVTGGAHAENIEVRALGLDLLANRREHVDGVLDRIAIRKLIGLAQDIARLREQHGFGGSRSAIDADEAVNGLAWL